MSIDSSSPASPSLAKNLIELKSSDGVTFMVEKSVALLSETIKGAIAENSSSPVQLQDVGGADLAVITRYFDEVCSRNGSAVDFVKELSADKQRLFGVIKAAGSLKILPLYDFLCQTVADMLIGKTPEEVASLLNLEMPLTPKDVKQSKGEIRFMVGPEPKPVAVSTDQERDRQERNRQIKRLSGPVDGEDEWSYRARLRELKIQVTRERRERMRAASSHQGAISQIPKTDIGKKMPTVSSSPASRSLSKNLIHLKSSDGVLFLVGENVTLHSEIIKAALAENPNSTVQLQDVDVEALTMIIEYLHEVCTLNRSAVDFAKRVISKRGRLFKVIMAAKSLKIQPIFDLLRPIVAYMMTGKTPEEIRRLFDIDELELDYTEEELKEVKEQMGCFVGPVEQEWDRQIKKLKCRADREDEERAQIRQIKRERRQRMKAAASQQGDPL